MTNEKKHIKDGYHVKTIKVHKLLKGLLTVPMLTK
jgi:hypothetical protein